jgi:hypothetical protein
MLASSLLKEGIAVQLDGAQHLEPFSVELSTPDGDPLFADPRFLMDRASRDPSSLAAIVGKIKSKIATPAPAAVPALTELPSSFLDSHLSTKVEYDASLSLNRAARLELESAAMRKKLGCGLGCEGTPTASTASSECGGDMMDVSDGGCCGK